MTSGDVFTKSRKQIALPFSRCHRSMQKSSVSCGRRTEDGITTFHFYCSCELANRMPKGRH
jgi:hypothetical protein